MTTIKPIHQTPQYKAYVLERLQNENLVDKEALEYIAESDEFCTPIILGEVLENHSLDELDKVYQDNYELFDEAFRKQKTTLQLEQLIFEKQNECYRKALKVAKILTVPDTNPKVKAIKKTLKEEYGIKNVYLDNNTRFAKQCLQAMKLLKENNYDTPDEIIGLRHCRYSQMMRVDGKNIILINTEMEHDGTSSTESPLHFIIHECMHANQPQLMVYALKRIPKQFKEIADNISMYANGNFYTEVDAELRTKKLLASLNEDEERLLAII